VNMTSSNIPSFTLDHNCIIDVEKENPNPEELARRPHILSLLVLQKKKLVQLAIGIASASERLKDQGYPNDIGNFESRIAKLGFGDCLTNPVLGTWGMTFWGHFVWSGPSEQARELLIFKTLFPGIEPDWQKTAQIAGVNPNDKTSTPYKNWRNRVLDTKAYWGHDHSGIDYFVSSDTNFGRKLHNNAHFPSAIVIDPLAIPALLVKLGISTNP
jgi:hypothetical protein